jgi:Ni/Co efflux regulator RcnB
MKRILLVLVVAAMMAAMMVASAAPAFAKWEANGCRTGDVPIAAGGSQETASKDRNGDNVVCQPGDAKGPYYDNHLTPA